MGRRGAAVAVNLLHHLDERNEGGFGRLRWAAWRGVACIGNFACPLVFGPCSTLPRLVAGPRPPPRCSCADPKL